MTWKTKKKKVVNVQQVTEEPDEVEHSHVEEPTEVQHSQMQRNLWNWSTVRQMQKNLTKWRCLSAH